MTSPRQSNLNALYEKHNAAWRDPAQVISHWEDAEIDRRVLQYQVRGDWWETLDRLQVTLLVTREYEHIMMAMRSDEGSPALSYMKMPHPSGLVFDAALGVVHVACTRNPNQIWDLAPVTGLNPRLDARLYDLADRPLLPIRSRLFPGFVYIHDLAMIGGRLYANSVGQNAVIEISKTGQYERVWWPRCIERNGRPVFEQNTHPTQLDCRRI